MTTRALHPPLLSRLAAPARGLCLLIVCLFVVSLVAPDAAHAAGTDGIENMAQNILDFLQGNFAKIIAAIAVIFAGFLFFTGRGSVQLLTTIVVGIFIVFSAQWIVNTITGSA